MCLLMFYWIVTVRPAMSCGLLIRPALCDAVLFAFWLLVITVVGVCCWWLLWYLLVVLVADVVSLWILVGVFVIEFDAC